MKIEIFIYNMCYYVKMVERNIPVEMFYALTCVLNQENETWAPYSEHSLHGAFYNVFCDEPDFEEIWEPEKRDGYTRLKALERAVGYSVDANLVVINGKDHPNTIFTYDPIKCTGIEPAEEDLTLARRIRNEMIRLFYRLDED
jgi:hypothetical protein